ncbi:MAG: sensor histidine kinase [Pseudohongiellaceae bacterium]
MPSAHGAEPNLSKSQLPFNLGPYLDYLEDAGGALTIDELAGDGSTDLSAAWRRSNQNIPTLGFSDSAHWFRIGLRSDDLQGRQLVLTLQSPVIDRIEFYFVRSQNLVSTHIVGDTIPRSELNLPLRIPAVPVEFTEAGEQLDVYFRVTSTSGIEIPLHLNDLNELVVSQQRTMVYWGAFFAFLFACLTGCLLLALYLKERLFYSYTLFFFSGILLFLCLSGLGKLWFWPESVTLGSRLIYFAGTMLILSFCLLGRSQSMHVSYSRFVNRLFAAVALVMPVIALYYLSVPMSWFYQELTMLLLAIGFVVALTMVAQTTAAALKGSKIARILLLSWILVVVAYLIIILFKFRILERSEANLIVMQSSALFSAILVLFAFVEYIRTKQDESVKATLEAKSKTDFLSNVSREFLAPVNLILSNSRRMLAARGNQIDEATRLHLDTVIAQGSQVQSLINDLLEMAELESDHFKPATELVEMSRFMAEIERAARKQVEEKGLVLEMNCTASANVLLQSDPTRLRHALSNLISNAIKYTREGKIVLGCKAIYFRRHLGVEISVKDTGEGMNDEFKTRLFQEFARDDTTQQPSPGAGLGLVIARRIIDRLGGEIGVDSKLRVGSIFRIRLPLKIH